MTPARFAFGPFEFDTNSGRLVRDGRALVIGTRGASLLAALLAAEGKVVSKPALMEAVWPGLAVEESNLSVQVAALRKLMGPASDGGDWIVTVPRVGYRFSTGGESHLWHPGAIGRTASRPGPAIAVMPFADAGGDADRRYFADGLTDDLIMALTRFRWFRVAPRSATFSRPGSPGGSSAVAADLDVDFIVEGAVRHVASRVRITAHLIDVIADATVWSDHFDVSETELFAVQDAIAERITGAIEPELLLRHGLPVSPHTGNITAWDLVRRGTFDFHKVTRQTHLNALRLFREAAQHDPMLPEARIWLARASAGLIAYGWSEDPDADGREGLDAALRAIYLDPRNPYSHYALAIVSAYTGRAEQAALAAERAVELGPGFALGYLVLGMARLFAGDAAAATEPLSKGLHLNPHDPQNPVWFGLLALARFFSGDVEGALETGRSALKARPDWPPTLRILACCHGALGHRSEARRLALAALDNPWAAGDALGPFREHNRDWAGRLDRLLREALGSG